ncbi:hypothetical protein KXD40_004755 [Peronospora effusa]|uniref:DNA replication checkpoint mediator MRC1 domain-containing protein n=1 Tax=Peronospora effusa TaxID=542832 RepID=A0A3M6VFB2_9STRA|nr:hypothetical protein DD238_004752 [Peronospora effusa]RQM15546.1 hypothetical protein DD237_005090 [Peronospora effusa]UIZ28439.1 hypothetical protein KXD40_004755 [Peronospora effusa]CAI5721163.1 unnamed protein product [Peronospora effusa]
MSHEELALETELLLQGVTQITQHTAVESVLEDVEVPPLSEYEAAKDALVAKLRKKKEANRAQQQQLNQWRYGPLSALTSDVLSHAKTRNPQTTLKLPVAATSSRKKQDMLSKLKTQAIQQGAQNMAELFGYANSEEHLKHLNRLEKVKIAEGEMKEKQEQEREKQNQEREEKEEEESVERSTDIADPKGGNDVHAEAAEVVEITATSVHKTMESEEQESVKVVRRHNRIQQLDVDEDEDGNEADSEQDVKNGDDADNDMEDDTVAVEVIADTRTEEQDTAEVDKETATIATSTIIKDKAAGYRNLLRVEAMQNRKRKRLVKGRKDNFVESEAEEDEEEDALKIGGLGDFGFGVPQAKTQECKEAEEERNALKLREDDLDHIVDDLSDDERAQEQDLEEMFRREQEDQDRQQVKEVMRNVKEGFGRNRRAFSGISSTSGARGRFNLDELVAADGSKFEAARLGLLESDEELSEDDNGKRKKANGDSDKGDEEEEEEREDEDEEAEMERLLRERFLTQPKIYVTSSESGSDNEEEEVTKDNGLDANEVESDEERERQQMKLFSERARINRRMQRMKDMQRQIALENNQADPSAKSNAAMPNLLLEEDEDTQELMHLLNRTDVDSAPSSQTATSSSTLKKSDRPRSKFGRFSSYGGFTSASRTSSSFSRVIDQCKMFSANSTGGGSAPSKGFVFTSFSSDKVEDRSDEKVAPKDDEAMADVYPELGKSSSTTKTPLKRRKGLSTSKTATSSKKRKSGGLFSVLSSYSCVSSTSQSQTSSRM